MTDSNKFESIAHEYSERFCFDPYYSRLASYLKDVCKGTVLEIGAANGILAERLDLVRDNSSPDLVYHSVEPEESFFDIARKKAESIETFGCIPHVGSLEDAIEASGLIGQGVDVLITSRSLHEALIGYGFDGSRLYSDLKNVLSAARPSVVIHGILERYDLLDETETEEFIQRQSDKLGHGHDPARDYLVFQELVDFMQANHYVLIAQDSVSQPLLEDHPDAWTFKIGVFRNEDS